MGVPVIVDAVRTPFGKRGGVLAGVHPAQLLGSTQAGLLARCGLDPAAVEQVIGGCVTQAGEQSGNVARTAWLHAGLPERAGATTIDCQCASALHAVHLLSGLVAVDAITVGMACGVEAMSRVPLLANRPEGTGHPRPDTWTLDMPAQYVAADRIAARRGLTREDLDGFGLLSQQRAQKAWADGRLDDQVLPVTLADGSTVHRDEGLRDTSMAALAGLRPIVDGGLHTAGTASQISDGASAALVMDRGRALSLGLRPRARILAQCLVGAEPQYLLDGPVRAAEELLSRTRLSIGDIDLFEVNEAFASVPLSFQRVHGVDPERLNVDGGAIALGHPVGATGIRLLATALGELERRDGHLAMVAICAGGALAGGAIIERL